MSEINKKFGKGLSSLLGDKNLSILDSKSEIDVNSIITNKNQPRKSFSDEALEELVNSIKKFGILQPILVRKVNDKYEIIAGERRFRSALLAGLKKVPVIVKNLEEKEAFSLSIIENIQREDLNPIEEANAYHELVEKYNYKQQEISEIIGKSRSHIANLMRLLTLPEKVKKYLIQEKIEMGHARALVNYENAEDIIDYIVDNKLTVREVETLIKESNIPNFKNKINKKIIPDKIANRVNDFSKKIGLVCKTIYNDKNGSGSITIKFKNEDELIDFINKFNDNKC